LLSASQASTLNKVVYATGAPKHLTNGYDICTYHNTGQHSSPIDIQDLTVTVISINGCWSEIEQAEGPGTKVSGVGDAAFGYQIGIEVEVGTRCLDVSGLTDAELMGHYQPDIAMAKIIIAGLG
jgi:hypothetical protein